MIHCKSNFIKLPDVVCHKDEMMVAPQDEVMASVNLNDPSALYDDIESFKKVVFQSDSEEDFTEGKRLTSLVRESYLKHVRQNLIQNYQVWYDNEIAAEERLCLSPVDIENCVRLLEQKALRSCMIASLYQKSMISLVSKIKEKTKEMKLFDNLSKLKDLNIFTSDVCVQTDDFSKRCDVECQTVDDVCKSEKRIRTTSLLDLPLPDPKDVLQSLGSDFIDGNRIHTKVNSVVNFAKETNKFVPQTSKPVCRVVAKRPSCSDDFPSESKRRKQANNSYSHFSSSIVPEKNKTKEVIDNFDLICMLTDNKIDTRPKNSCSNNDLVDIVSDLMDFENENSKSLLTDSKLITSSEPKSQKDENIKIDKNAGTLDDRLAEMGISITEDSNTSSMNSKISVSQTTQNFLKTHHGSWFLEMTAHYCNLVKAFLSLSDFKKAKLKEKFIELFDNDEESDRFELTERDVSICRKRTAHMVVTELTPYFVKKKIASRYLFKEFAKRVTDSILTRTYASDSYAVNQFVTEFFCEHNIVESVEDIDFN